MVFFIGLLVASAFVVVAIGIAMSEPAGLGAVMATACVGLGVVAVVIALRYGPTYDVWQQGLSGQASLARATQDRMIKIQEAEADKESAVLNAEAEVSRAEGAAKANKILMEGLGSPENYLRWKWIEMLQHTTNSVNREIIYAPAGGMLPLTEAGRAVAPGAKP